MHSLFRLSSFPKEDDLEEPICDERTAAIVKRDKVLGGGVMYIAVNIRKVEFRYTTVAKVNINRRSEPETNKKYQYQKHKVKYNLLTSDERRFLQRRCNWVERAFLYVLIVPIN